MNYTPLTIMLLALLTCSCVTKPKDPKVEWIGNPAVRTGDRFISNVGWIPGYEYGFREDGVMVWRKVKE